MRSYRVKVRYLSRQLGPFWLTRRSIQKPKMEKVAIEKSKIKKTKAGLNLALQTFVVRMFVGSRIVSKF